MATSELLNQLNVDQNGMLQSAEVLRGKNALLHQWLNHVEDHSLTPSTNLGHAKEILHQSQISGQTVAFVAIGCADWVDWSNETEKIWHIGKIDPSNKRAERFVNEVSDFQRSLTTLGITSVINIALSNVEMNNPHSQGLDGRFDDHQLAKENIATSNQSISKMLLSAGVNCQSFDHWKTINQLGFNEPVRIPNSYLDFIKTLYSFDLTRTGKALVRPNQLGPIWLDIQSFNFPELVEAFRQELKRLALELPILAPFKNCGNWHSKAEPKNFFPTALDLMQSWQRRPAESPTTWVEKTLHLPDETILAALNTFEVNDLAISGWKERIDAVRVLSIIAFSWDPIEFINSKWTNV